MTEGALRGRVIVVAGSDAMLSEVCRRLVAAEALVAFVSDTHGPSAEATLTFRAAPSEVEIWQRTGMHIEQKLGPVDGVVTDDSCDDVVRRVFGHDLARRGHGAVVRIGAADSAVDVLNRLADTQ